MHNLIVLAVDDPINWGSLFQPIADDAQTGILAVAGIGLAVFGVIFVLTMGKRLFRRLAS